MKKNELLQSIKIIGLCLVLSIFVSYASAFVGPTGTPSNSNSSGPINAGTSAQSKNGDLVVNGLGASGNTILSSKVYMGGVPTDNIDIVPGGVYEQNVEQNVDFLHVVGTTSDPKNSSIIAKLSKYLGFVDEAQASSGSTYNWNNAATLTVRGSMQATGDVSINGNLTASVLANLDQAPVCADNTGKLFLCNSGSCGSANGAMLNSAPTTQAQLCSIGTYSSVTAVSGNTSGPWTWTCSAVGGVTNCGTSTHGSITFTTNTTWRLPAVNKISVAVRAGGGAGGAGTCTSAFPNSNSSGKYSSFSVPSNNVTVANLYGEQGGSWAGMNGYDQSNPQLDDGWNPSINLPRGSPGAGGDGGCSSWWGCGTHGGDGLFKSSSNITVTPGAMATISIGSGGIPTVFETYCGGMHGGGVLGGPGYSGSVKVTW